MSPTLAEVSRFVEALQGGGEHDLVVFDEGCLALPWGFRVVLQPRKWVETREFEHMLFGHGPTYVTRSGRVFVTGSAKPAEFYEAGLAWELTPKRGFWHRLFTRPRGWRSDEYVRELPRDEIVVSLRHSARATTFYQRLTGSP